MKLKNRKSGVSLISLIITIIVIIILAAVVIFSGMDTPEKAQLSKVISDIDNVQTAVDQAYYGLYTEKAVAGEVWTQNQFYEAVAKGITNRDELSGDTGIIEIQERSLLAINLPEYEGRKWGLALEDLGETVKTGSVLLIPGYASNGKTYATLLDVQNGGSSGDIISNIDGNGSDETFVVVEPTNVSDWKYYDFNDESDETLAGTVYIEKYSSTDTVITIPNSINGKRITMLGSPALLEEQEYDSWWHYYMLWSEEICHIQDRYNGWYNFDEVTQETITKIIISNGIKRLNKGVFAGTINLQEVILPNSIEYIGYGAFESCTSLTNITIPSSVEYIDSRAFRDISPSATITCHFAEKPEGWADDWTNCENVIWAGK